MCQWHLLLLVAVMAAGCGGSVSGDSGGSSAAPGGGSGGSDTATGGLAGGGQTSAGAGGSSSGGQGAESGGAGGGSHDDCNQSYLWYTVTEAAVSLGVCSSSHCDSGGPVWGVVGFDSEGQATEITGLQPGREGDWMQEVAGERWPCLADTTVEYCCGPDGG